MSFKFHQEVGKNLSSKWPFFVNLAILWPFFHQVPLKILVYHIYEFENSSIVTILETGDETMTGGRIKKGFDYLNQEEAFLTYGDGIANIDIDKQVKEHYKYKPLATLTAVRPPARFGSLKIMDNKVTQFNEKT